MNITESETANNMQFINYYYDNSIKLLEYKKNDNKTNQDKQKSNSQFLQIAKLFENMGKHNKTKDKIALDLDSAIQYLNLCMAYQLF